VRSALVAALIACADSPHKSTARRFLRGLSSDELQFIAGFLGACVLEFSGEPGLSRTQWAERISRYQQALAAHPCCGSEDQEHKMIVLLEYLCRSGSRPLTLPASA
jgi:hypothetical protein